MEKRTFKVMAPIAKHDGGHWWMRCGTGYMNRDNSINIYLDAMTREMKFTLRELDEEDLRRRDTARADALGSRPGAPPLIPTPGPPADDEGLPPGLA